MTLKSNLFNLSEEEISLHWENLPATVAVNSCVVLLTIRGDVFKMAHPDMDWDESEKEKVEWTLDRKFDWLPFPGNEIEKALRLIYGNVRPIENCNWDFAYKCPKDWSSLEPTADVDVRDCGQCNRKVYRCYTQSQAINLGKQGQCICFVSYVSGETMGDYAPANETTSEMANETASAAEVAALNQSSRWPACSNCNAPAFTPYGKQCFDCGAIW